MYDNYDGWGPPPPPEDPPAESDEFKLGPAVGFTLCFLAALAVLFFWPV